MALQLFGGFNSKQKRIFEMAWVAGTRGTRSLSGRKLSDFDISKICKEIMKLMKYGLSDLTNRFSLRLCVILTNGVARIHLKRVIHLQSDLYDLLTTRRFKPLREEFNEKPIVGVKHKRGPKICETPEEEKEEDDQLRNRRITLVEDDCLLRLARVVNKDNDMGSFEMQTSLESYSFDIDVSPQVEVAGAVASSSLIEGIRPSSSVFEPMMIEEIPVVTEELAMGQKRKERDEPARDPKRPREDTKSVESEEVDVSQVYGQKRKREDSLCRVDKIKVLQKLTIKTPIKLKISRTFKPFSKNDLEKLRKPTTIDDGLFQEECYRWDIDRVSAVRGTDATRSPTIDQINLPEQLTPEVTISTSNDVPNDLPNVPSIHSIGSTASNGARTGSEQGSCSMELTLLSETGSVESNESKKSLDTIIKRISGWNLENTPMTIEEICDRPHTKLKMAKMFSNLLTLSKQKKVVLKTEENSLELASISKGPEFP